jgi:hypothetical protein
MGVIVSITGIVFSIYKVNNWPGAQELDFTASEKTPEFFFTILLFSVIGAVFFSLGLRLREQLRVNLALVIVSIGAPIISYESYLEFSTPPLRQIPIPQDSLYDTRTKIQVIEDLRLSGIDAYPNVLGNQFLQNDLPLSVEQQELYPLGGISKKSIVHCNESGQWAIFNSDEHGFNNPNGLFVKDNVDIMLMGDSFAEGACVNPNETIAAILRNFGFRTISLGKGGNGPLIELASLREYAVPIQPKVILWLHYAHDFDDLKYELTSPVLLNYLADEDFSQNLVTRQEEIDDVLIKFVEDQYWKHKQANNQKTATQVKGKIKKEREPRRFREVISLSRLVLIIKLTNLREIIGLQLQLDPTPKLAKHFTKILQLAKKKSSSWDAHFYIVYLHSRERYESNTEWPGYFREFVLRTASELNIPVIDIHKQVFKPHPDPLSLFPFRNEWHYNAKGYSLVAQAIARKLRADGVLQ